MIQIFRLLFIFAYHSPAVLAFEHASGQGAAEREITMPIPTDPTTGEPGSDKVAPTLRAAAELFAGEALTFAATLDDCEFEAASASDAVRLFGAWLCQVADDLAASVPTGATTTLVPHHGLIS